jgi:ankyrin repeat protein
MEGAAMSKEPGFFRTSLNVLRTARRFFFSKGDIHVEAAKGNLETLQELLAHNPQLVNLVDKMDYGTPLHWAAVYGQPDACKVLLAHNADINLVDELGHTPLNWAIGGREEDVVRLLIEHGANVNHKDLKGRTPLQVALEKSEHEIAAILREHGATESESNP